MTWLDNFDNEIPSNDIMTTFVESRVSSQVFLFIYVVKNLLLIIFTDNIVEQPLLFKVDYIVMSVIVSYAVVAWGVVCFPRR